MRGMGYLARRCPVHQPWQDGLSIPRNLLSFPNPRPNVEEELVVMVQRKTRRHWEFAPVEMCSPGKSFFGSPVGPEFPTDKPLGM